MTPIHLAPKSFVSALNKFRRLRVAPAVLARSLATSHKGGKPIHHAKFSTAPVSQVFEHDRAQSIASNTQHPESPKLCLKGPRTAAWWTGKNPTLEDCPGRDHDGKLHSIPFLNLSPSSTPLTRKDLQAYFDNTWALTEALFSALQGREAFVQAPYHGLRHPLVFYYGHPAVFYINKLRVAGLLDRGLNPYFEVVFETGVDEMSWDDLSKNAMDWPSVESIHAYRKMVYATVSEVISNISDETCATITPESPLWCLPMAMEHERIHIETSSVLMNELPLEYVRAPEEIFPAYHPSAGKLTASQPQVDVDYPQNAMISVPHTQVNLGKPAAAATYGWDNEYGQRSYDVPAFSASQFKVSNGEFAEFVRDGGYSKREHWTERGWEWRAYRNAKWPTFWLPKGPQGLHQYDLRLLFDVVPMPWSWPVAVNLHEANAFAMWRGAKEGKAMRVMTELEYTAMRDTGGPTDAGVDAVVDQPAGTRLSDSGINGNLSFASMSPVDAMPPNAGGFYDVVGNAWEWNIDYFSALSGFKVHPFYEDFSSPCFDGLHNVIQGSSFISTGNLSSVYSRYHFRPHFFQHASFRVVHSASETVTSDVDAPGPYVGHYPYRQSREGLKVASQREYAKKNSHDKQLSRHFGPALEAFGVPLPTFTERLTDAVVSTANQQGINLAEAKVLDIGCGPGAISLQLAKHAQTVIGVDHSADDIRTAKALFAGEPVSYTLPCGGDTAREERVTVVPAVTAADSSTRMCDFRLADPMCLPAELQAFDVVLVTDVLDKVSSPNAVLGRLGGARGLVRPGGLLVVTCAYEWSETHTPRSLWLGSEEKHGGDPVKALDDRMADEFIALRNMELPWAWRSSFLGFAGKNFHVSFFQRK